MFDFLVIGAGFYGCTFARVAAEEFNKKILIVEKDFLVGGLAKTRFYLGIQYHVYGPHILHTDSLDTWKFLSRFGVINNFKYNPVICNNDRFYSFPFNIETVQQLNIKKINTDTDNTNFETYLISKIGLKAYRALYYHYTKKMWGTEPRNLPASIAQRVPIRETLNNSYYEHTYQGVPQAGYSQLLQNMIEHKNITIERGVDFLQNKEFYERKAKNVIFTGSIDAYYRYKLGDLSYRTLEIDWEFLKSAQERIAINWADKRPYTRTICHNYWLPEAEKLQPRIISKETPKECEYGDLPMYPTQDKKLYNKYLQLDNKVIFKGRLGEYVYRDMCPTVEAATAYARTICTR